MFHGFRRGVCTAMLPAVPGVAFAPVTWRDAVAWTGGRAA